MRSSLLPLLPLALAACGGEPAPPAPKAEEPRKAAAPAPAPAEPEAAAKEVEASGGAAGTLRRYYALIESGRYEEAAELRSDGGADAKRLADNFKPYESYRAMVGTPSRPVEAAGWQYVEVPVMITGRFRRGKGFGSAGSVTLRRATSADGERQWRIHAGR